MMICLYLMYHFVVMKDKQRRVLSSISKFENDIFDRFEQCSHEYDSNISKNKNTMQQLNEEIEKIESKLIEFHTIQMDQQAQAVEQESKVNDLRKELDMLTLNNKQTLPNEIKKMENAQRDKYAQLKKMETELSIMIRKNEQKIQLLERDCNLHENYLGMKFNVVNGMLSLPNCCYDCFFFVCFSISLHKYN